MAIQQSRESFTSGFVKDYSVMVALFQHINPGETKGEVILKAGMPDSENNSVLSYDFTKLPSFPRDSIGKPGTQILFGAMVTLDASAKVQTVRFSALDSSGSAK